MFTLSAKPWLLIQREMRTPIAPILLPPTHVPVSPSMAPASTPNAAQARAITVFQVADVLVDVSAIRLEVEDGIADELARAVVGDVAAAPRLAQLDAERLEPLGRREHVRPRGLGAAAEGDHVGMFQQQQDIPDLARPPLFDERALQFEAFPVGHEPQLADLEVLHSPAGSKFSSCFFTTDMNSSATAPSMMRWS